MLFLAWQTLGTARAQWTTDASQIGRTPCGKYRPQCRTDAWASASGARSIISECLASIADERFTRGQARLSVLERSDPETAST